MSAGVIKPEADVDFYVWWSSFWDTPTAYGTRAEMLEHHSVTEEHLARADEYGTSWHDMPIDRNNPADGLILRVENGLNVSGYLRYSKIPELIKILLEMAAQQEIVGPDEYEQRIKALLHPDDNDDEPV